MNCHDAKERILEGRETAAVRRHLERCTDCTAFVRELDDGGREISEAYLADPPAPGFEERVAARLGDEEISVRMRPATVAVRVLVPALLVGLLLVGYGLLRPGPAEIPTTGDDETVQRVVTETFRENPLEIAAFRGRTAGPTLLMLGFAGETWSVPLGGDVESLVIKAWTRGARKVELTVAETVPFREVTLLLGILEKAGFAYEVDRPKS